MSNTSRTLIFSSAGLLCIGVLAYAAGQRLADDAQPAFEAPRSGGLTAAESTSATAGPLDRARDHVGPGWPAGPEERATTSGDIYRANLDGQIAVLERRLDGPASDSHRATLATLLYHRFQLLGRLTDAERARALLADGDGNANASLAIAEARVALGFHDFPRVSAALERAALDERNAGVVDSLRSALERARGEAWTRAPSVAPDSTDPVALVQRAADQLERGRVDETTRLLRQAQDAYTGTSPYVLAWIQTQQGIAFLRHGDMALARQFFQAAHERLPAYALAAEHLAETELELGNLDRAEALYRSVYEQTLHPEFLYQLGLTRQAQGFTTNGERLMAEAREQYRDLLGRYPLMFADHGAHHFLATGATDEALELARLNRASRADLSARLLLLEVEAAAGRSEAACTRLAQLLRTDFRPPELADVVERLGAPCTEVGVSTGLSRDSELADAAGKDHRAGWGAGG